jgi:uncharacterized membrane protein
MSKHHQWLARELPVWVDKAVISDSQADALRALYPVQDTVSLGRLLLTGIGAIMIGLGVILLFAYNWADMGKFSKLAVIFGTFIAAHALAMITRSRNHTYSESLFALGTMLMGSGIFLVGQIYHMDSHYPNAFLLWAVGALLLAWALPSLTQAFMALILIIGWHLVEVVDFHFANHSGFLLILLGIFPLLWRLHSPVLARFAATGLFLVLGFSSAVIDEHHVVINLILTATALIGLERIGYFSGSGMQREITAEMAKPAMLVLVGIMYLMSFADLAAELLPIRVGGVVPGSYFFITLLASQAVFFLLLYQRRLNGLAIVAELTVLLVLLPFLSALFTEAYTVREIASTVSLGFNLLLLAISVWLMVDGARNANRQHMVRGSILFALLAMARYTDLFDSLIARASVFLLVGTALFAVSHVYQRNKKQAGA